MAELAARVADQLSIPFTVGGGIRTAEDFRAILLQGADKISINSAAIDRPALISEAAARFGSQCVVVAIDARRREDGSGWDVYKNGGRLRTGLDALEWAAEAEPAGRGGDSAHQHGRRWHQERVRSGDDRRGFLRAGIPVIASGGAGTMEHFAQAFTQGKADAVLAASLFHYHEIAIPDLKAYLAARGIPVRPVEG